MKPLKKSPGIAPLWGRAVKQIPEGEMDIIYVAYQATSRKALADLMR